MALAGTLHAGGLRYQHLNVCANLSGPFKQAERQERESDQKSKIDWTSMGFVTAILTKRNSVVISIAQKAAEYENGF